MYCFCTLAVGEKYRILAKKLAEDLAMNCQGVDFLILTDKKEDFLTCANVKTYDYLQKFKNIYFDKILAVEKALTVYESAIFIDANSRIYDKLPQNPEFQPGLTVLSSYSAAKHLEGMLARRVALNFPVKISFTNLLNPFTILRVIKFGYIKNKKIKKIRREIRTFQVFAARLKIDYRNVKFIHEILFALTKQGGAEKEFFRLYYEAAEYLQRCGFMSGEGIALGLAAEKSNLNIINRGKLFYEGYPYFKDRILMSKIGKGQKYEAIELELLNYRKSMR